MEHFIIQHSQREPGTRIENEQQKNWIKNVEEFARSLYILHMIFHSWKKMSSLPTACWVDKSFMEFKCLNANEKIIRWNTAWCKKTTVNLSQFEWILAVFFSLSLENYDDALNEFQLTLNKVKMATSKCLQRHIEAIGRVKMGLKTIEECNSVRTLFGVNKIFFSSKFMVWTLNTEQVNICSLQNSQFTMHIDGKSVAHMLI